MPQIRLVDPTDFQILEALSDGCRNTAVNLAVIMDKDRSYLNTRLPVLADAGLIARVGPAESSGLYQITPRGVAAAQNRSLYAADRDQFATALDEQAPLITITDPAVDQPSSDTQGE
jgi:predicted transcriptional regulator